MIRPTKDIIEKSEVDIVATQKTKTVSGKSDLTYHLGKDDDSNAYLRIWVNSSNGYFSNEYLSLAAIISSLEKQGGASFTSFAFQELFKGKSVNTPGFLVAALLNEAFSPWRKTKSESTCTCPRTSFWLRSIKRSPGRRSRKPLRNRRSNGPPRSSPETLCLGFPFLVTPGT